MFGKRRCSSNSLPIRESIGIFWYPLRQGRRCSALLSGSSSERLPWYWPGERTCNAVFSGISPEKPPLEEDEKGDSSDSFEGEPKKRRKAPKEHAPESLFEDFPLFEELSEGKPGSSQPSDSGSNRDEPSSLGTLLSSLGGEILLEKREGAEDALLDEVEGDLPDHEE